MKTEMGESLVYSWLRHVKLCQLAQTNWKTSPNWKCDHIERLEEFMKLAIKSFEDKYGNNVFKGTNLLSQLLKQGEIDAVGTRFNADGTFHVIAVDVAFHAGGLLYGRTKEDTALAIARKCLRSAMCLAGYFPHATSGEIIFASPKVTPATLQGMIPAIELANQIIAQFLPNLQARMIVNSAFCDEILLPVLELGDTVADTSELFLRSYQMLDLFGLVK